MVQSYAGFSSGHSRLFHSSVFILPVPAQSGHFCDYTRNSQGESSVISIDGMDATPMGWHLNITWESGSLGMCLMPESEYRYDGTCKPKRPDVFTHLKGKEKLRGYIAVRNTGNSPAIGTVLKARWCVSTKPPDVPPAFVECSNTEQKEQPWTDGPRVLFPGNGDSTLDVTGTFFVSTEDARAITLKEKWFYYIGTITYDREDKPLDQVPAYSTDFCIFYDPRGYGEDFSLYYCPRGNTAR